MTPPKKPNLYDTFLIERSDNRHFTIYSNSSFYLYKQSRFIRCNIKEGNWFFFKVTNSYFTVLFSNLNHAVDDLVT